MAWEIVVGVAIGVIVPTIWGVVTVVKWVGRIIADHVIEGLVDRVDVQLSGSLATAIADVQGMLTNTFQDQLNTIQHELTDNTGSSLRDIVTSTRRTVTEIRERLDTAEVEQRDIWNVLSDHGMGRREGD